ncbi:type IX secretion system PorP/SprF family membrane protein [Aquimarina brevivitae]|uniref:Type IX secretion system PorP/SprF family membrane protein n=2 Tax=Aquimarina brevivitae TaxID=323412 RepID=A0A4Q7PFP2_9FLAO|nr:type IX secretion system PorP/SprF family membrane protein [Aquimarina brevivitae]
MKKLLLHTIFILLALQTVKAQDEDTVNYGVLPTDIPTHTLVRYNRFYFNPTFSLVRENKKSINVYNKQQWVGFNDNPQTFLLSYTSNFDEKTGVSIGLFQQNEGIYRYFGGTLNYAYNLEFDRDVNLTFGMNLGFSQSGLKSNIDSADSTTFNNGVEITDPVILNYENSSVFLLSPGFNFNYNEFDAGVTVSNLVAYNISGSELITDNMAFRGHVMYTRALERRSDKSLRGMAYANMLNMLNDNETELRYGANVLVDLPELGWGQAGYDSFYGVSLGVGGHITPNVSVGYTFETGMGDTSAFGSTHEVVLAYNFALDNRRSRGRKTTSQKAYEERDSEIRRLKKEILEQNRLIRELQERGGDSLSQAQRAMSRLEQQIQEAKEEEARQARQLALQREEEVELLNRKSEEEERLASQRQLEQQVNTIEQEGIDPAEEARIAAEEAAREEEARKQQEQEDRLTSQKQIEQTTTSQNLISDTRELLTTASVNELRSQADIIRASSLPAVDKQNLLSEIDIAIATREAELQRQSLLEQTRTLIASGSVNELRSQADIIRASSLPQVQKQSLLSDIDVAIATREADQQRQLLLEETRTLIASGGVNELRNQADIIRASSLPAVDKQNLLSEIDVAIAAKQSENEEAEEQRRRSLRLEQETQQLITETEEVMGNEDASVEELRRRSQLVQSNTFIPNEQKEELLAQIQDNINQKEAANEELKQATRTLITSGSVNELRSQADIIRASSLPAVDKQNLLSEIDVAIAAKETANQEAELEELKAATRALITSASVNELRSQADIIRASNLPAVEKQNLLSELDVAIAAKEAEAQQAAEQEQLVEETRALLTTATVNELRSQADIIRASSLPEVQKQSLISELELAITTKLAEEQAAEEEQRRRLQLERETQQFITETRDAIANETPEQLRRRSQLVQSNTFISDEEKQALLTEIEQSIATKEVELQRQQLMEATRTLLSSGGVSELRNQADIIRASNLPEVDKQNLLSEIDAAIAAKEAEAARLEEQQQREAEEARQRQELIDATRSLITSGTVSQLRDQADIVRASELLPQADKQSLLSDIDAAIARLEAEEAQAAAEAENQATADVPETTAEEQQEIERLQKELEDRTRISSRITQKRDSLLNSTLNLDKRDFTQLLESLVAMDNDAADAKSDSDPTSSKRLSEKNRFIKFAEVSRPEAQYATKFIPGYPEGYYLIGNVFKGGDYAEKFEQTLKDLGFNGAQVILNPENDLQYVSIASYTDKDEAARKYLSNIDNAYYGDMWILHIAKSRVESYKRLLQETRVIEESVKDDTVLTENLSFIGGHSVENGYYLITDVFKRENYFERGMERLRSLGLEPQFFRNPKDNYIYVYLKRFDTIDQAKQSLFSNVGGTYSGELYILKVE